MRGFLLRDLIGSSSMYVLRTILGGCLLFPLTGMVSFYLLSLLLGYKVNEPPNEYVSWEGEYIMTVIHFLLFGIPGFIYSVIMASISPQFVTEKMKKTTPKLVFKYSLIGMCAGGGPFFIILIFFLILGLIGGQFSLTERSKDSLGPFLFLLSFGIAGMLSSLPILKIWLDYRDAKASEVN